MPSYIDPNKEQKGKELCLTAVVLISVMSRQRLQIAFLSALTLQALDLLDRKAQVAEQLARQPGHVAEPSLVLDPTQN